MDEIELRAIFTSLCKEHGLNVQINPVDFTIKSPAALDVEHDEEGNLVGIGVYDSYRSLYFTSVSDMLRDMLLQVNLIGHNAKGDFDSLRQWEVPLSDSQLIWDSFLLGHIIDSSLKSYGLKDMAARELGIAYPSYEDIVGKHKGKTKSAPKCPQTEPGCCGRRSLDRWPVDIVAMYNAMDCYCTYKLYEQQVEGEKRRSLGKVGTQSAVVQYFNELEKPVSRVFGDMETRGICVDIPYLRTLKQSLELQRMPLEHEIKKELGDINLNSPKQLLGALNGKGIKPQLKGKPSTDKRALDSLKSNTLVAKLLQFSEYETLLSSFVYPYLERKVSVVHPFFNQCGTRTGRPSCSNPNLLQIPKKTDNGKLVRKMFIPRPGMLLGDSDLSGIEPRMLAHLSQDKNMLQLFNDGTDFHNYFAERVGVDRNTAKVFDLETYYRATKHGVARTLSCTLDKAQSYINMAWDLFPELRRWEEKLIYDVKRCGFLTTLYGRRIKIEGLENTCFFIDKRTGEKVFWIRDGAERQLMNNIAQGSAAEVMKLGMLKVATDKRLHPQFGLLIQVYDQLVAESPAMKTDIVYMKEDMETAIKLSVPLLCEAKIGVNWAEVE